MRVTRHVHPPDRRACHAWRPTTVGARLSGVDTALSARSACRVRGSGECERAALNRNLHPRFRACVVKAGRGGKESCHEHSRDPSQSRSSLFWIRPRSRRRNALPAVRLADFAAGETVFDVGEPNVPSWLVLEGSIDAIGRDGRGRETYITTHHAGQFSGELSQLAGRQSLAIGRAGTEGATAIPFDDVHVRALMIGSPEIGEIMMRAFILRRVGLIERGAAPGRRLIGTPGTPWSAHVPRVRCSRPQRLSLRRVLDPAGRPGGGGACSTAPASRTRASCR